MFLICLPAAPSLKYAAPCADAEALVQASAAFSARGQRSMARFSAEDMVGRVPKMSIHDIVK